jgi:hypothetical protein
MTARLTLLFALALGACGGPSSSTGTPPAAGGERPRPTGTPIASSGSEATVTGARTLTREAFEAQWAAHPPPAGVTLGVAPPRTGGGPYAAYGGMGYDLEHPIPACGPGDSYQIVASYVCADGSVPLGGDPGAGGGARVGNVGANSTGHIIDLYEVPCPTGPVQLFVDMYACGGGGLPF